MDGKQGEESPCFYTQWTHMSTSELDDHGNSRRNSAAHHATWRAELTHAYQEYTTLLTNGGPIAVRESEVALQLYAARCLPSNPA